MLYLLFSAALIIVAAQQNIPDPIKDFCRRHQHQTCIIDSILYIDGGKVIYGGSVGNDSVIQQNTRLLWEDIRDTNNPVMFPTQYKNLTKGTDVPSTSGGVLWPDVTNKLFYLFGGEYDGDPQAFTNLWFFDVIYNTWNKSSASDGSQNGVSWPASGAGTVSDAGVAYYYGGYLNNKTVPKWVGKELMLNSLTSFDMNSRSWSNHTYDEIPRAEGTLHYLPASASGMLAYFFGVEMTNGAKTFVNMSQIQLLDINDNRWFTQSATGDIPLPRRGACAGVVWAADRSSFNFYVWGGIGETGEAFDEAYILSLPSFQWIRIHPAPPAPVPNYGGKGWSSCNVIFDSQMIVMGGLVTNKSMIECDVPSMGGQHGLLLGQENVEVDQWWHAVRNDTKKYRVPNQIIALIGGNQDGQATKTAPANGWATPSLSGYWKGYNWPKTPTATRVINTATDTQSRSGNGEKNTNVGAIAGGTVGGVLALAIVSGLLFLCLRRRRIQKTAGSSETPLDNTLDPHRHDKTPQDTAHDTMSQVSTVPPYKGHSPAYSPAYSPQPVSPPQGWLSDQSYTHSNPHGPPLSGEWSQQAAYPHQQTFYPPPLQSPAYPRLHEISAELPDVRSPANAELSDVRSPLVGELPDVEFPKPMREHH